MLWCVLKAAQEAAVLKARCMLLALRMACSPCDICRQSGACTINIGGFRSALLPYGSAAEGCHAA